MSASLQSYEINNEDETFVTEVTTTNHR